MPANAAIQSTVSTTSSNDTKAVLIRPFAGDIGTWPKSYVSKLCLQSGRNPSYAECTIPLARDLDEKAPTIAGVVNALNVKVGDPISLVCTGINMKQGILMYVVNASMNVKRDAAVLLVQDYKYKMVGMPIIGSLWVSKYPGGSNVCYRGDSFFPNKNGAPNMIWVADSTFGELPVMCPEWYGHTRDSVIPEPEARDQNYASYWTPEFVSLYSRIHLLYTVGTMPWLPTFRIEEIDWSDSFASPLRRAGEIQTRKAQSKSYGGAPVIDILEDCCRQAGDWGVWIDFSGSKPTLMIVPTRFNNSGAKNLSLQLSNTDVVVDGNLSENGANLATRFVTIGDFKYVERRVSTVTPSSTNGIQPQWAQTDLDAFNKSYKDNYVVGLSPSGDDDKANFNKTAAQFPNVFAMYVIDPKYKYLTGTGSSLEDDPQSLIPRGIKTTLLTADGNLDDAKSSTASYLGRARFKHSVPVEWYDPKLNKWNLPLPIGHDGFTVIPHAGVIILEGLRDRGPSSAEGYTWVKTGSGSSATFAPRDLRLTLAFRTDQVVTGASKLSIDPSGTPLRVQSIGDEDRISPGLERVFCAVNGEYKYEARIDSWPTPEAAQSTANGNTPAPAKNRLDGENGPLVDDRNRAQEHSEERLGYQGRLDRGGDLILPYLDFTWSPGHMVGNLGNYPIRGCVRGVIHSSTASSTPGGSTDLKQKSTLMIE